MAKLLSKDFKKRVLVKTVPPIAYLLLKLLFFTCKKKLCFKGKRDIDKPAVIAFWHGELLMAILGYIEFRKGVEIDSMISDHSDGEMIARVIKLFGGGVVRGSSTKGGIKALKGAFKTLELKRDLGITPDGPKGPRHSVAEGIVLIARKKGVPVVTINCKPSSYWQFDSWDKFVLPKPFSTLNLYIGEPLYLDKNISVEEAQNIIQERLLENAV